MADQKLTERTVIATSLDADLIHVVQGGVSYKHSKTNLLKEDRVRLTALETPDYTTQGNTFNGVSQLVQTTAAGILPALDGSLLTNLPSGLGIGTVTSVVAGNGLDFTTITGAGSVTMGTPASTTGTTINAVSATSHTHALDMTGVSVAAADVTIADAGGLITATNVEGALQENRTLIDVNTPLAADAVLNADTVTTPMGFVIDEDSFASDLATKVPTQQSVKAYVTAQVASAIVGGVYYQGGYNAGTNTPDLETPVASTVFKGFMWTVTVLGDFFTEAVQVGDVLIAEVDDPSVLTDWTVVQSNLDASSIKALYESNADTNAFTDAEQTKLSTDITGTLTTNKIPKATGANSIGDSQVFDNGTNVGIGTTAPTEKLDVVGKIALNDGGDSVFIGTGAGLNDDGTSNNNVGVGHQALYSNTTGSNNTANGYAALRANTTGGYNTANGYQALYSNTTGVNNAANGYQALYSNTTGASNTANGHQALYYNTTGSDNTANGHRALFSNITGVSNTANGYQAGRYIANKSTGATILNNSVMLGWRTSPLADNQTNQIVIGYDATGAGSNTATLGNTSITKTILRGNVETNGSSKVGDDVAAASATNVGAIRYRADANNSYAEMVMQTGAATYAWTTIVQHTW